MGEGGVTGEREERGGGGEGVEGVGHRVRRERQMGVKESLRVEWLDGWNLSRGRRGWHGR